MSVEENKADTRCAIEEFWNQGKIELLDEFWAPDYVNHDPTNPEVRDLEGFKQWVIAARTAFPDLNVTIDDLIADEFTFQSLFVLRLYFRCNNICER